MGEVIREIEAPLDGHDIVRVYAHGGPSWRAWLDFISLDHADLRRSPVLRTAATREELVTWAMGLTDDELRRALEDAELVRASELGRPPVERATAR